MSLFPNYNGELHIGWWKIDCVNYTFLIEVLRVSEKASVSSIYVGINWLVNSGMVLFSTIIAINYLINTTKILTLCILISDPLCIVFFIVYADCFKNKRSFCFFYFLAFFRKKNLPKNILLRTTFIIHSP